MTEVLLELLRLITILAGLTALLLTVYVGIDYTLSRYPALDVDQQKRHMPPATVLGMGMSYGILLALGIAFTANRVGMDTLSWQTLAILLSELLALVWLVGLIRR